MDLCEFSLVGAFNGLGFGLWKMEVETERMEPGRGGHGRHPASNAEAKGEKKGRKGEAEEANQQSHFCPGVAPLWRAKPVEYSRAVHFGGIRKENGNWEGGEQHGTPWAHFLRAPNRLPAIKVANGEGVFSFEIMLQNIFQ